MGNYNGYNSGRKRNLLPTANLLSFAGNVQPIQGENSFYKRVKCMCICLCVCICVYVQIFQMVCRLFIRKTKIPQVFFLCTLLKTGRAQKGREREARGSAVKTQPAGPLVLDIRCDPRDHEHLSQREAGSRGGAACGATGKRQDWNANGNDIKHRPNDLLVPWLVSKHSVLQFSYHQVLFPPHDKVRT